MAKDTVSGTGGIVVMLAALLVILDWIFPEWGIPSWLVNVSVVIVFVTIIILLFAIIVAAAVKIYVEEKTKFP